MTNGRTEAFTIYPSLKRGDNNLVCEDAYAPSSLATRMSNSARILPLNTKKNKKKKQKKKTGRHIKETETRGQDHGGPI